MTTSLLFGRSRYRRRSQSLQSALGEKQVCLTLDTMANSFQIAEWPSDGEAAARAKNLGLRRESVSIDSSDDKADVHFAKSRVSLASREWDSIFGTQKIKQHSRWPMKFVFEDVGMFIRGSDGRSLTFSLLYSKEVTVTLLTKEEREVFCLLVYLLSGRHQGVGRGRSMADSPCA